jgi:hypothetical protein
MPDLNLGNLLLAAAKINLSLSGFALQFAEHGWLLIRGEGN